VLSKLLIVGVVTFGVSVLTTLALLFANGGTNKSRQFAVLSDIFSGRCGIRTRVTLVAAMCGLAVGAIVSYTAVAISDGAQIHRCQAACVSIGFDAGRIRLSQDTSATRSKLKVCGCFSQQGNQTEIDLALLPSEE